ncbi:MAG: hypothetical protein ACOC9P_02775 [bacterium]
MIDFAPHTYISDFTVSADGTTVYAAQVQEVLDLWHLLVVRWPVISLGPLVLVWLWLAWRIRKLWRRRKLARGEPHCARCAYQLTGVTGEVCPECGATLSRTKPITGRPIGKRVGAQVGWMALAGFLYLALAAGAAFSSARYWVDWQSVSMARWARQHTSALWLRRHMGAQTIILEIPMDTSPAKPRPIKVLHGMNAHAISLSPETSRCYVSEWLGEVRAYEIDSFTRFMQVRPSWSAATGLFTDFDEDKLYFAKADGTLMNQPMPAARGNWREGDKQLKDFFSFNTGPYAWIPPRNRVIMGMLDEERVLGVRNKEFRIWRWQDGELLTSFQTRFGTHRGEAVATEPSPRLMYVTTYDRINSTSGPVEVWDLQTGKLDHQFHGPRGRSLTTINLSPGGRYLCAWPREWGAPRLFVRDLEQQQWVGTLDVSKLDVVKSLRDAAEGTRLLALGRRNGEARLLVYDLPELHDPEPEARPTGGASDEDSESEGSP